MTEQQTAPQAQLFNAEWFPMYHRRFLASTQAWDAQTIGAYFLLLCYQWDNGNIPTNPKDQRRIARCSYLILEKVTTKFTIADDGLMKNEKLEAIRFDQHKKYLKSKSRADNTNLKKRLKLSSHVTSNNTLNIAHKDEDRDKENEISFKNLIKSDFLNEDTNAPVEDTNAEGPYQTDNTTANQIATNELLDELLQSDTIVALIGTQVACNPYEAGQMRNMFVNHIRGTGLVSTNNAQLRSHCVNWCRSHAHKLIHAIHNTPQLPRPGREGE